MDYCEKAVKEYILHLGYKEEEVLFEPEGQEGPDFVIKEKIAVEVRMLNRHVGVSRGGKCLTEEDAIPVISTVAGVLRSFGPPTSGFSWFVCVECSLPAPDKDKIERELRRHLKAFQNAALQKPAKIQVLDRLAIELLPADGPRADYFLMGAFNHDHSGELLSDEFERNLKFCIDAKAEKLSRLRSKDRESCWLALADLISYGYYDASDGVSIPPHNWDKVIVINPLDQTKSLELA